MDTEQMTATQVYEEYKDDMLKLIRYLPWLESKSGQSVSSTYSQDGVGEHSLAFPVYDGTLMNFVKDAQTTKFMDRNYRYVLTRNRLNTVRDRLDFVEAQNILKIGNIGAILSEYVMGGQTRARMWSEAMNYGIFLEIVRKLKELYDFWENAAGDKN